MDERRKEDPRIQSMAEDIKDLKKTVKELRDIFIQAKGAITFVKCMAAVIAAGAATWAWIVAQIHSTPRI